MTAGHQVVFTLNKPDYMKKIQQFQLQTLKHLSNDSDSKSGSTLNTVLPIHVGFTVRYQTWETEFWDIQTPRR